MSVKEEVLACLEQEKGAFISGEALAQRLGVSRNAVWKAIKALEAQGYAIEGVTKKGYRLAQACSILSAAAVRRYAGSSVTSIEYHDSIDSTNNRAKELATQGCPAGTLVVANQQTAGRGRQGRPFYSPSGSGVYFSLVLRPGFALTDITAVTSYAAVCTAQSIEEVFGTPVQIKWVNDLFAQGRKCCGILTEASILPESGGIDYIVVGIGVNVSTPQGGFPARSRRWRRRCAAATPTKPTAARAWPRARRRSSQKGQRRSPPSRTWQSTAAAACSTGAA